jgi:putative endopeptidase
MGSMTKGRKSDGRGVLRDWWTPQMLPPFEVQAAKLGAQYEAFEFPSLPGQRINGRVSMGENIGDLGGSPSPMRPIAIR